MSDYPIGAFFLTRISGRTGWWVGLAQALAGIPSRWTHGGIIGSEGRTYEAGPGGVYIGSQADLKGKPHLVCDALVTGLMGEADLLDRFIAAKVENEIRCLAADAAHAHLGTPYSFLDYLALALLHLEAWVTGKPTGHTSWWLTNRIRRRVQNSGHLICSAFIDHWASHMDVELFDDDRLPGDVTPADLDAWVDDHRTTA